MLFLFTLIAIQALMSDMIGDLTNTPLRAEVVHATERYLKKIEDFELGDLHLLLVNEVEKTLLSYLAEHTKGNQSRMTRILGISRSTLRKKLRLHGLL